MKNPLSNLDELAQGVAAERPGSKVSSKWEAKSVLFGWQAKVRFLAVSSGHLAVAHFARAVTDIDLVGSYTDLPQEAVRYFRYNLP